MDVGVLVGEILVIAGLLLAVAAIMCRMLFFHSRVIVFNRKYTLCLVLAFLGTLPAYIGYIILFSQTSINTTPGVDYSQILTLLSLLAAGTITGFFTFTYENVREDEKVLPTLLSMFFVAMFYLLFFLISYYAGRSKLTHNIEGAAVFVPSIMWLLLLANTAYDFLDYRVNKDPEQQPKKP